MEDVYFWENENIDSIIIIIIIEARLSENWEMKKSNTECAVDCMHQVLDFDCHWLKHLL